MLYNIILPKIQERGKDLYVEHTLATKVENKVQNKLKTNHYVY